MDDSVALGPETVEGDTLILNSSDMYRGELLLFNKPFPCIYTEHAYNVAVFSRASGLFLRREGRIQYYCSTYCCALLLDPFEGTLERNRLIRQRNESALTVTFTSYFSQPMITCVNSSLRTYWVQDVLEYSIGLFQINK